MSLTMYMALSEMPTALFQRLTMTISKTPIHIYIHTYIHRYTYIHIIIVIHIYIVKFCINTELWTFIGDTARTTQDNWNPENPPHWPLCHHPLEKEHSEPGGDSAYNAHIRRVVRVVERRSWRRKLLFTEDSIIYCRLRCAHTSSSTCSRTPVLLAHRSRKWFFGHYCLHRNGCQWFFLDIIVYIGTGADDTCLHTGVGNYCLLRKWLFT